MDWATHIRRILARLGEDVTWTHLGSPATVRGIFLSPYQIATFGDGAGIGGSDPRFAAMSADLPAVARGDTITRGAVVYRVLNIEPDDPGGFAVLQLEL